jgi:large conductance mechanosensitive channel
MPIVGLPGGIDFTKRFVTLDGNSYADLWLLQKRLVLRITYGNLVQAIINCNYCFLYFLCYYELLKSKKKRSGCCCCSCWTTRRAINAN